MAKQPQPGIDAGMIKLRYSRMSDAELQWVALHDSANLTPEAQEIIREEITKRKLDTAIHTAVEAQNTNWSEQEISAACALLQSLNCPYCGGNAAPLNAAVIRFVTGVLLFSKLTKRLAVGCPQCLNTLLSKANGKTIIHCLISNPLHTFRALAGNANMQNCIKQPEPTPEMMYFTAAKTGIIKAYENDREKLNEFIRDI
jgi:hypothetical protein